MNILAPKARRFLLALLALLLMVPLGCKKEEKPAEEEEEHAAPVKWEPAEKADLEEWTELLGTTQPLPNHSARVSAPVEGHVLAVLPSEKGKFISEGQRVQKGQILVQLDDRILRANRDKLVAGHLELKEQIEQAKNNIELARIDIERLENLRNRNGTTAPLVTQIELDKGRLAYKDAESKHKAAQAKEEVARAEVKAIDEQLDLYTLRTPIAGQLGLVHAVPGQTLPIGTTIAEVVNLDAIDVLCNVPPRTVHHLKLNQEVETAEAGEEEHEHDSTKLEPGRVVFIADVAQPETGLVAVKVRFPNQKRKLRANTLIRVRVLTEKKTECLTIPEEALLEDQEEPAVLVVETEKKKNKKGEEEEEHHVHRFQAKLGLRDREKHKVEILGLYNPKEKKAEPLEKDTLFVVEGGHGLEDDDLVTLKKEEEHGDHKEGDKKDEHKDDKKDEHKDDKKDEHKDDKKDAKKDEHKDDKKDEKKNGHK